MNRLLRIQLVDSTSVSKAAAMLYSRIDGLNAPIAGGFRSEYSRFDFQSYPVSSDCRLGSDCRRSSAFSIANKETMGVLQI